MHTVNFCCCANALAVLSIKSLENLFALIHRDTLAALPINLETNRSSCWIATAIVGAVIWNCLSMVMIVLLDVMANAFS